MPATGKPKTPVVNAVLAPKAGYVRVADWQGKSLTFFLAEEIFIKQKPGLSDRRRSKEEKTEG